MENKPLLSRSLVSCYDASVKVLQFGTGAFLKGFVNAIIEDINLANPGEEMGVCAVKLRQGNSQQIDQINAQQGLFSLQIRGIAQGKIIDEIRIISCQQYALSPYDDEAAYWALSQLPDLKWIVSNSTEAGIAYHPEDTSSERLGSGFPAKLTQLLYKRWQYFHGEASRAVSILCCELIDDNSHQLLALMTRYAREWQLPEEFIYWLSNECCYANTLVDRIVPGKPVTSAPLGYIDNELIEAEPYYLWAIECRGPLRDQLQRMLQRVKQHNVVLCDDLTPFRTRKVRVLNGGHTSTVAVSLLAGVALVRDAMNDADLSAFMASLLRNEVAATLQDQGEDEIAVYVADILDRFKNPYLAHAWQSILMNSISKTVARLLPTISDSVSAGNLPRYLLTGLAALLVLYRDHPQWVNDSSESCETLHILLAAGFDAESVSACLVSQKVFNDTDLASQSNVCEYIASQALAIQSDGVRKVIQDL